MNLNEYPLWTALVTPMNDASEVDYPALEKLAKLQADAKNGLLILGSTGESLNLDLDEKKKIIEFIISLKLAAPIMVGVGGANLRNTSAWVDYLEDLKIDAYLMVTPLYAKPEPKGQYLWFKTLMDRVKRPVVLYNIPGRTGKALSLVALEQLKLHPNFWGIKEASGSPEEFSKFANTAPEAKIFSGDDALLPSFKPLGCIGLISVSSNVWPKATHEYVRQVLDGEFEDQEIWNECAGSLFCVSNPIPAKRLLKEKGLIDSAECRLPLSQSDLEDPAQILEANKKIEQWYNKFNQ
ncbi:MAG: 4-hydroxy-tetrahydrodipicolinate synthase [Halobacteriovoraceae bacterium]|jgi:4-hydroxy-tetrahydrodipicolinate synthase|nr:4-hydroxy-tetrahydrodipicolinate synthase [Halobacteriovoraceae bacterium]MBT5094520.1 4-hydroxy-tetrahydrodipicolinate synthase [Halobacteriovoraceae bacterium]